MSCACFSAIRISNTVSAPAKTQALEALVEAHARELHLPAIRARFRALAAEALREQQTPLAYLAALLEAEIQERAERREHRRLLDARFPLIKRLEEFRYEDNPKVPPATIAALAEGSWIDDRESVILIGESGTGKTMLATGLAICACQQGRRVRFTILAGLANELQEAVGLPGWRARRAVRPVPPGRLEPSPCRRRRRRHERAGTNVEIGLTGRLQCGCLRCGGFPEGRLPA